MQILSVPIQQLLTSIVNTNGAAPAEVQTTATENSIFGQILSGTEQAGDIQLVEEPEIKALLMQGLENPEVASQIKTALAGGGKISLEVNNPKDILAGLLAVVKQNCTPENTAEVEQPALKIDVENLLNSLKIKEVVVDTESTEQVVDKFMEQLKSLFDKIINIAEDNHITNLEELTTELSKLSSEIETGLASLITPEAGDVKIDFSKIKVIIPPGQNKELFGLKTDEPVTLIESAPVETPVPVTENTEEQVPVENATEIIEPIATEEPIVVIPEDVSPIIDTVQAEPVLTIEAEIPVEQVVNTTNETEIIPQPIIQDIIEDEVQPEPVEIEDEEVVQVAMESPIIIVPQPVLTEISSEIEIIPPVTQQEQEEPTAAITNEVPAETEEPASVDLTTLPEIQPVVVPIATILPEPVLPEITETPIVISEINTVEIPEKPEMVPVTNTIETSQEVPAPQVPEISVQVEPVSANTDIAQNNQIIINNNFVEGQVDTATITQEPLPVANSQVLQDKTINEIPLQQTITDPVAISTDPQPAIQDNEAGSPAPISSETITEKNEIATNLPIEGFEPVQDPVQLQVTPEAKVTQNQDQVITSEPVVVENNEMSEAIKTVNEAEAIPNNEDLTKVPITRTIREALNSIITRVMEKINPVKAEIPNAEVVIKAGQNVIEDASEVSLNPKLLEKITEIQLTSPEMLEEIEVKVEPTAKMISKLDKALDKVIEKLDQVITKEIITGETGEVNLEKLEKIIKLNLAPVLAGAKVISENNEIKISLPGLINSQKTQEVKLEIPNVVPIVKNIEPSIQNIEPVIEPVPVADVKVTPVIEVNSKILETNTQPKQAVVTPEIETEVLQAMAEKPVKTEKVPPKPEIVASHKPVEIPVETNIAKPVQPAPEKLEQNIELKAGLANTVNGPKSQLDRTIDINKAVLTFKEQMNNAGQKVQPGTIYYDLKEAEKSKPVKEIKKSESKSQPVKNGLSKVSNNMFELFMNNSSDPAIMGLRTTRLNHITINTFNINDTQATLSSDSVVNQVIEKIRAGFEKNEIRIALNPENLGKVDVSVTLQRGIVVAHLITETAKAMESLKTGTEVLRQALIESGVNVDKIVVQTSEKSTFTGNNGNNSEQNNSAYREQANNTANNNANQQDRPNAKEAMDLSQFKQSQNGRFAKNNADGANNPQGQDAQNMAETATKAKQSEANYINTERGRVNYRV